MAIFRSISEDINYILQTFPAIHVALDGLQHDQTLKSTMNHQRPLPSFQNSQCPVSPMAETSQVVPLPDSTTSIETQRSQNSTQKRNRSFFQDSSLSQEHPGTIGTFPSFRTDMSENRAQRELKNEEDRKRELKRARNRIAAAKCRQKKTDAAASKEAEVLEKMLAVNKLEEKLNNLLVENQRLQDCVNLHNKAGCHSF